MQLENTLSEISPSAATIGSNTNLLTEFLVFFPAKSLIKFRSVSKQWRSLISSPSFCRLHTLHHHHHVGRPKSQPAFLLRVHTYVFFTCHPTLKTLNPFRFLLGPCFHRYVKILQSCNGLLLLECRCFFEGPIYNYVYNPTTMQSRDLKLTDAFHGLCLVFDPSKSLHYKVICFKKSKHSTTGSVSVYYSETHIWKDMGESCFGGGRRFLDGVYWNDSVYFIQSRRRFSVDDEKVYRLSVPARNCCAIESSGYMHCVLLPLLPNKNRLCVFELSDDVDLSWNPIYDSDLGMFPDVLAVVKYKCMSLIGMVREEKVEDSILLFHVPGKILVFKFGTNTFEELVDFTAESYFEEDRLLFKFIDAHHYIETLAPI